MNNSLDVQRTLDDCMLNIKGAREVMADDMPDAAMKLGAAAMMLASASNELRKRVTQLNQPHAGCLPTSSASAYASRRA